MSTIVIHPDGEVETYETPTAKEELKLRFDLLETELQLQGYETEKYFDKGSGVMTLRAVPPCPRRSIPR